MQALLALIVVPIIVFVGIIRLLLNIAMEIIAVPVAIVLALFGGATKK